MGHNLGALSLISRCLPNLGNSNKTLKGIARELADRIKENASLDWTQWDAVRADMRRTVWRMLTKYGYQPDLQEAATTLVIQQAELMARNITTVL